MTTVLWSTMILLLRQVGSRLHMKVSLGTTLDRRDVKG